MARCPQCARILSGDPAYPRPLRPGPAVWCYVHVRVEAVRS